MNPIRPTGVGRLAAHSADELGRIEADPTPPHGIPRPARRPMTVLPTAVQARAEAASIGSAIACTDRFGRPWCVPLERHREWVADYGTEREGPR